jgi:hypothetical protein
MIAAVAVAAVVAAAIAAEADLAAAEAAVVVETVAAEAAVVAAAMAAVAVAAVRAGKIQILTVNNQSGFGGVICRSRFFISKNSIFARRLKRGRNNDKKVKLWKKRHIQSVN